MENKRIAHLKELGIDINSSKHFDLIRLLNISGAEESEILVDEMLGNKNYLTEYFLPQALKEGGTIVFGHYWQQSGSKAKQPIEWIVLSCSSSKIMLMSKKVLDWMPFTARADHYTQPWRNSNIKRWLNENFINTAFSSEEKNYLKEMESGIIDDTYNEFCPDYAVGAAEPRFYYSSDKVLVMCPSFGECPGIGTFRRRKHGDISRGSVEDRCGNGNSIAHATSYAISKGAPNKESCAYWLRSLGQYWGSEAIADEEGWLERLDLGSYAGIRPVITLDLSTDISNYILQQDLKDI